MDVRNWKRVLLFWISEFEYTDKSYNNVEQSDVEAFYEHIRQHHHKIEENVTLLDFFEEHYSAYRPHVDDQNELSSADYVYVYSLLLHFTCVKQPESYFREKCNKLANAAQEAIALFFKLMLECSLLNKENLRHIIGEVAASVNQKLSPKHLSDASSSSGTPSPAKTPSSKVLARISPSTPKTILLDERTRELFNLRAELDNERYEKSVLETQIRENEFKINKLSNDCKKYQQKLLEMKHNFQESDYESTSSSTNEAEEQYLIIRRLKKEIEQKDLELTNLTESLCSLRDEVSILNKRLSKDMEDLKMYDGRLQESNIKIVELTNELEKKNCTIKNLSENKKELEYYIGEMRSYNGNVRVDLNNSSDCLDASFIRSNVTLSPSHAPENMSSVVDLQLREKTREVQQLQQDLIYLREKNSIIIQGIKEHATIISKNFHVPLPKIIAQELTEQADPVEYFQNFIFELKELNQLYLDDLKNMQTLREKLHALGEKNAAQDMELSRHKDRIEVLESENREMSQDKQQLETRLAKCMDEITQLLNAEKKALNDLEVTKEQLAKEYGNLKSATDLKIYEISQQMETDKKERLELQNQQISLLEDIESYRLKLQESQEKNIYLNKNYQLEMDTLKASLSISAEKLQQFASRESLMKEKYEKISIERESLKEQERHANAHLDKMQALLHEKEKEMLVLGEEISEVRALNTELEKRVEELSNDFKSERHQTQERIAMMEQQETQLQKVLEDKISLIAESEKEMQKINSQISTLMTLCDLSADEMASSDHMQQIIKTISSYKQETQEMSKLMEEKLSENTNYVENMKTEIEMMDKKYEKQTLELRAQLENAMKEKDKLEKELKIVIEKHNEAQLDLKQLHANHTKSENEYVNLKKNWEKLASNKAKLEEKFQELKDTESEIAHLREQEKLLIEELEHIKCQQAAHEAQSVVYEEQIKMLEFHLTEHTKEMLGVQESREEKIKTLTTKVNDLEEKLSASGKNYAEEKLQHGSALKIIEESMSELRKNQELLSQKTELCKELEQKYIELELRHQNVKIKDVETHSELEKKIKKLTQDLEEQQTLVERTDATLRNILATLENAANSVMELACPADDLENLFKISQNDAPHHLQDLKRCLNKLVNKLTVLEREVEFNREALNAKNKELLDINQEQEAKSQELSIKLVNLEKNIEELESKLKTALEKEEELQAEMELLINRLQESDKEKKIVQENLDREKICSKELEEKIKELTNTRDLMEKKLKSLSEVFDKSVDMKQQTEYKFTKLKEQHEKLVEAHDKLQQQLKENASNNILNDLEKKSSQEKFNAENSKLNKRIEQLALQLGEAQAIGNNLKREQKKLLESHKLKLDTLQNEKEKLLTENNSLKERIARSENLQEQLTSRITQLDTSNSKFQVAQRKWQNEKDDMEVKLQQVQRQRESLDEKLRKLNTDLEQYEQIETRLKLEVGALNSQLEMERKEKLEKQNAQAKQMENLSVQVGKLNMTIQKLEEQLERLEVEIKNLKTAHEDEVKNLNAEKEYHLVAYKTLCEEKEILEEKLHKTNLAVDIEERELLLLRTQKTELEEREQLLEKQLQEIENENEKLLEKYDKLLEQAESLRKQLADNLEICSKLEKQSKDLQKTELTQNEQLNLRVSTCEEMLSKEQNINAQLRADNQILQAKYAEAKARLQENVQRSEERIKENRLELEGKLEKMKNKMVSLQLFLLLFYFIFFVKCFIVFVLFCN